jgi:hypothetical protein
MGSSALGEATYGINFNPPGTPYPFIGGTTDSNASGASPSIINGLIYCGGSLTFPSGTSPSLNGCIVSAGNLAFNAASASLVFGNGSYLTPPPGFTTSQPALYPITGSWQRVTH